MLAEKISRETEFSKSEVKAVAKKVKCLDCGKTDLILVFSERLKSFQGDRVCGRCKQTMKRKYMEW